jgi:hypothetical protein
MTMTRTTSTLLILSVGLVGLITGFDQGGGKLCIDNLKVTLNRYNSDFRNEKAYLMTDRFVYRPGEDIWFKGFVSSFPIGSGESQSEDFYIKLLNNKGEEIIFRRYPLSGNTVSGRLLVPRTSIPGKYYLVAYTAWMKNQLPEDAFRKEILISKYYEKRFIADVFFNKQVYYPGDSLRGDIRIIDASGKPLPGTDFSYAIGSLTSSFEKGNGTTDERGFSVIRCVVPGSGETLLLTIEVSSRKVRGDYTVLIPATTSAPEITFHPEGGNLLSGASSLVAFRSVDNYGQPAGTEGEILDSRNNIIQRIKTNSKGLGSFEFNPPADTCFFKITEPRGISRLYPLPVPGVQGLSLRYKGTDRDSAIFLVRAPEDDLPTVSCWVAVMNRHVVWSREVIFSGSEVVKIPVGGLDPGVMQVTLFDPGQNQVAERLINVTGNTDKLIIKTDRTVYSSRQRVSLTLDYQGRSSMIETALSVSLRQLADNPMIADFKKNLHSAAYDTLHISEIDPEGITDLDLLTTNYRVINWQHVLSVSGMIPGYYPQNGLNGKVFDRKENTSQHAKVRVTHIPNYRSYETQTNEKGDFQILFGSDLIDFNYLNVDAYDALGKVNLSPLVDHEFSGKLKDQLITRGKGGDKQKIQDIIAYGDPDVVFTLRYGPGRFRKSVTETKKKYDPTQYADYSSVMEIIQDIEPYELKGNTIVFSKPELAAELPYTNEGSIIVINGMLKGTNVDILRDMLPSDITNINISSSLVDVNQYTPVNFRGVIEITTIQGMYRYRQPAVQWGMDILNTNRKFFSPNYSKESTSSTDNRKTLYWNPQTIVNSGQPVLMNFYTSDTKGVFYGRAEGFDKEGNPIIADFTFTVE